MTNSRYEIREPVGKGGLGAVYKAFDTQLQREVALKRILSTKHATEEEVRSAGDKLLAEAQTLSSLNHPNIVTVFDVGQDEEGGFVVMELLNGETLDDTVSRGVLTQEDFTEVVFQTMEALIAAQAMDVLHRDLKPPNVMVIWQPSGKFQTKILDFGLAKFSKSPSVQTMDQDDAVMGSIFFMAPEQFERAELDTRTDLYQIGCVYYHALTGQYPFRGETAPQVMNAHLQHRVTPLEKLRPDLAPSICQWVMWLINRDMTNRPGEAREALEYFPRNPEAPVALPAAAIVEPTPTGQSTVKIVAAPTHAAAAPSGIVAVATPQTGSSPIMRRSGATGAQAGNVTGSAPVAAATERTGIPVQPPKSKKMLIILMSISLITILGTAGLIYMGKAKRAKEADRFLALSKMEEPTGSVEDVKLAYKYLTSEYATPSDMSDARKILIDFKGDAVDPVVLEGLQNSKNAKTSNVYSYILGERGYDPALPAMMAAFRKIPATENNENVRRSILNSIRKVADKKTVPEMLKELSRSHGSNVRTTIENIILAVLRKEGNSKAVTGPLIDQASKSDNKDERQSLFRILGLLGGEDVKSRLSAIFKKKDADPNYQLSAIIALTHWQNQDVLPLLEEIVTTAKNESLKIVAMKAYLKIASLPTPATPEERVQTWQKALDLAGDQSKRMRNDMSRFFTSMMDYPNSQTEAKLNELAGKPVVGGIAKSILGGVQKMKADVIEIGNAGDLPGNKAGVRGDQKAGIDRFAETVTGWISPETYIAWHFKVKEAGAYQVEVQQANPGDGTSEFQIVVDNQVLKGESTKTESYEAFKTVTLQGNLNLEPGRIYTLHLRAGSKVQPRLMDVKAIRLVKK